MKITPGWRDVKAEKYHVLQWTKTTKLGHHCLMVNNGPPFSQCYTFFGLSCRRKKRKTKSWHLALALSSWTGRGGTPTWGSASEGCRSPAKDVAHQHIFAGFCYSDHGARLAVTSPRMRSLRKTCQIGRFSGVFSVFWSVSLNFV